MSKKKKEKKQKTKAHTLYAFVVLLLAAAIVAMSVLLLFHVQTIEIAGNAYVSSQEISDSIQSDQYTKNSLYLMGKNMAGQLALPKSVESAKIRMKTPWSIRITVREKKIMGYTVSGDEYVYFDEKGMVLHKSPVLIEKIPHIEGIEVQDAPLYETLPVKEKRLFRNIREAKQAFVRYELKPERLVSNGAGLTAYLGNVCAELGSGDMELKIMQIPPILAKLEGKTGTLDLRHYNENSEIISFREGELPKTDAE